MCEFNLHVNWKKEVLNKAALICITLWVVVFNSSLIVVILAKVATVELSKGEGIYDYDVLVLNAYLGRREKTWVQTCLYTIMIMISYDL